jgi:hypothetical protein
VRFHVVTPVEERGVFTQEEFEALATLIENTNNQFCQLRNKHPIEQ